MGERWYLQVDGVDGESAARGFEKSIEADSYSWEVTATTTSASGRGVARRGRPTFGNLIVTAPISVASPPLVAACVTGQVISSVVLSGARDGDGRAADVFVTYELEDAMVVGVRHADDPATVPTERLEFTYATVRITYTPQDPRSGRSGPPVTTEHSVVTR